jgi:hypothetical protein
MKKVSIVAMFLGLAGTTLLFTGCKKNKCAECHYELGATQVDIGEYCGEDLENIEASGYLVDSTVYEVHCGEH